MTDTSQTYALQARLDLPYDQAVEQVTAALKEQGFGVLTEIDVQATLKQKLGADFRKYVILGACNPALAQQALAMELNVGLLLPCNVIVYEEPGGSMVAIGNPVAMLGVSDNPDLKPLAQEVKTRLQQALQRLTG